MKFNSFGWHPDWIEAVRNALALASAPWWKSNPRARAAWALRVRSQHTALQHPKEARKCMRHACANPIKMAVKKYRLRESKNPTYLDIDLDGQNLTPSWVILWLAHIVWVGKKKYKKWPVRSALILFVRIDCPLIEDHRLNASSKSWSKPFSGAKQSSQRTFIHPHGLCSIYNMEDCFRINHLVSKSSLLRTFHSTWSDQSSLDNSCWSSENPFLPALAARTNIGKYQTGSCKPSGYHFNVKTWLCQTRLLKFNVGIRKK